MQSTAEFEEVFVCRGFDRQDGTTPLIACVCGADLTVHGPWVQADHPPTAPSGQVFLSNANELPLTHTLLLICTGFPSTNTLQCHIDGTQCLIAPLLTQC